MVKYNPMIIITEIKTITVDRDPHEIWQFGPCTLDEALVTKELISGRRFRRPSDGIDVVIGATIECQDILGLQYDCWESMIEMRDHWQATADRLEIKINRLNSLPFWGKIKWAFKSLRG